MRNSIDSATFAWLTKECRWARHGMFFLLKLHLRTGNQSGPHLPHASLGPLESITQTASRLVQPFLHSSRQSVVGHARAWPFPKIALLHGGSAHCRQSLYFTMRAPFLPKLPLPIGWSGPHLKHIPWARPRSQPKQHLDRFRRFCTAHRRVSLKYTMDRRLVFRH